MLLKSLLLIATVCVIGMAQAEQSPVFIWGAASSSKPALKTIAKEDFAELVAPLLVENMVVVFLEHGLSSSDLTCTKTQSSKSCYAYLQGIPQKTYFASVENPSEAILSVAAATPEFTSIGKSGKLETPLEWAAGKVAFVTFENLPHVKRDKTFEAHDEAIRTVRNQLSSFNVIYMYMAEPSPAAQVVSRMRRETAAVKGGYIFGQDTHFLIFYTNLIYKSNTETEELIINTVTTNPTGETATTQFDVSMTTSNNKALTFTISREGGYFQMSKVIYDGISFPSKDVNAPTDFSYYCGNLTLSGAYNTTTNEASPHKIIWNSLQLQAPFSSSTIRSFGDAWHCVGFFTPGILGGLFVVILLLAITFTGICWMVDINTMDRFDDPKGKTITINVAE